MQVSNMIVLEEINLMASHCQQMRIFYLNGDKIKIKQFRSQKGLLSKPAQLASRGGIPYSHLQPLLSSLFKVEVIPLSTTFTALVTYNASRIQVSLLSPIKLLLPFSGNAHCKCPVEKSRMPRITLRWLMPIFLPNHTL